MTMRKLVTVLGLIGCLAVAVSVAASAASNDALDPHRTTVAAQPDSAPVPLRDEAAMVLVGSALIGLGAAVRRAA